MTDNEVYEVAVYDLDGNECYFTKIATFNRVTSWLADKILEGRDNDGPTVSKAVVRSQHYDTAEVDLLELWDRLVIEGYIH